ncbi:MAG: metal ABC transporter substrate-binding protein [Acidobacteriota bacterium]
MPPLLKLSLILAFSITLLDAKPLQVVSTLPDYASIAAYLGGDRIQVKSIAAGYQDAHFVKAKPSFARMLSKADLFLSTGLDLELWAPVLVDKSRNPRIRSGASGYVSVSRGMTMMDIPKNPNRSAGDIHIYGNPHLHTDPLRGIQIAANILIGLKKVDPAGSGVYDANFQAFQAEVYRRLYGEHLVQLVGGTQLARLSWNGQLDAFLDANQFQGKPLRSQLGGWLAQARCLRHKEIVAYHKNWIYFATRFGIRIADYVEAKPGIPPSARHVVDLIEEIQAKQIKALLTANYFDESAPRRIEEKTGAKAVVVPLSVGGTPEAQTYFDLFDIWIGDLKAAYESCQ